MVRLGMQLFLLSVGMEPRTGAVGSLWTRPGTENIAMPQLYSILETALYVDDMDRAKSFYETVMQLASLMKSERLCAYDVNGAGVLLLFIRHGTLEPVDTGRGIIPPHDGTGRLHMAFACSHEALPEWQDHLTAHGVTIESRTSWKRGGESIYFRDPDGNLLELAATPGLWPGY